MPAAIALIACMGLCLLSHGLAHYDHRPHSHHHHQPEHHQQHHYGHAEQPSHQYSAEHGNQLVKLHQPHAAHHARHHHQHQHHPHYHHGHRDRTNQAVPVVDEREPQHLHLTEWPQEQQHAQRDKVHATTQRSGAAGPTEEATVFSVSLNIDDQTMAPHLAPFYAAPPTPAPTTTTTPTAATSSANVTHAHHQHQHQHHQKHQQHEPIEHDRRHKTLDYSDNDYYDDDDDDDNDDDAENDANRLDMTYDSEINDNPNVNEAADWLGTRQQHAVGYAAVTLNFNDFELKRPQRGAPNAQRRAPMHLDDYADDERGHTDDLNDYQQDDSSLSAASTSQRPGVLTEQKQKELGTPEAVQRAHDAYVQRKSPAAMAREHMNRMRVAASCKNPQARVVNVSNDTSKLYVPHRTILHRCGDDTGCCDIKDICVAKRTEIVELYFYVSPVGSNRFFAEAKHLPNDTECHCISLKQYEARRNKRHNTPQSNSRFYYNLPTNSQQRNANDIGPAAACKCPNHFEQFVDDHGDDARNDHMRFDYVWHPRSARHTRYRSKVNREWCRCDCSSSNETCKRLQNGHEGFPMNDRKCIAEQRCQAPKCSTGVYNIPAGRCPTHRTDYAYG